MEMKSSLQHSVKSFSRRNSSWTGFWRWTMKALKCQASTEQPHADPVDGWISPLIKFIKPGSGWSEEIPIIRMVISLSGLGANFRGFPISFDRNGETFTFCISERIGYLPLPDSFWKHESFSDSHIIKLLFQGIQFKLGFSFALVGKLKLLCLGALFDSEDSLKKSSRSRTPDLTTTKRSELIICLWSGRGDAGAPFVLI